jgi:hypothetical protein
MALGHRVISAHVRRSERIYDSLNSTSAFSKSSRELCDALAERALIADQRVFVRNPSVEFNSQPQEWLPRPYCCN